MHPTCFPRPTLPVELVELTLGFLQDDIRTLSQAALTCKALLPKCRTLIWSDITIPVLQDSRRPQPQKQTRFLELIDTAPELAPYVRSLTVEMMAARKGHIPLWTTVTVWDRLPKLRTLTLRSVGNGPDGDVPLCLSNLPFLETLVLDEVYGAILRPIARRPPGLVYPPSALVRIVSTVRLKRLSINGGVYSPSLLADFADDLLKNGTHASLESIDLRWSYLYEEPSIRPLRAWAKVFASLGPQLRHCGLSIACDRAYFPSSLVPNPNV